MNGSKEYSDHMPASVFAIRLSRCARFVTSLDRYLAVAASKVRSPLTLLHCIK
jgi:hypothetical protein